MAEYKFDVTMTCSGCSNAVSNALIKANIKDFDVSLETQKVVVRSSRSQEEVLEVIQKTGKAVVVSN